MTASTEAANDISQNLLTKEFLIYEAPSSKKVGNAWLQRTETIAADCELLLSLEDSSFFSILADPTCAAWDMIDSYLKNCPRFYEGAAMKISFFSPDPKVSNAQRSVHRQIFLVLLRAAGVGTQNDLCTKVERMDVPLLCDVSVLYGQENEKLVKSLVCSALDAQPPLVTQFIDFTRQVQCLMSECSQATTKLFKNHASYNEKKLASILNFLVDLAVTLTRILFFFPNAAFILEQQGLTVSIPPFYCEILCPLGDYVNSFVGKMDISESRGKLAYVRKLFLGLFNSLLNSNIFERLSAFRTDTEASSEIMANYFSLMRGLLHFQQFSIDYEAQYPFAEALEKLYGESLISCFDHEVAYLTDKFSSLSSSCQQVFTETATVDPLSTKSAVTRIRDFVPSYVSDEKIEELLKRFDGCEERVVNAIMDNCFEDEIAGPSTSSAAYNSTGDVGAAQASSANADEVETIYEPLKTGKKRGAQQDTVLAKGEVDMLKGFYTNYVQTLDADEGKAEYSDEYDDTYEE
ncbi:Activating signal cointegrator 1 complex subunit 2 [Trichuris trichiura]|uniref:Activating signal cointegrator 1 complex subunit 2 n=1 Tax=Trichuris trichiura TaxID=36087 RepID=A0A077Z935_TRITR|nr:Activating signal cointegrator 1 complex subunit 2 [Trichuris trichiura]